MRPPVLLKDRFNVSSSITAMAEVLQGIPNADEQRSGDRNGSGQVNFLPAGVALTGRQVGAASHRFAGHLVLERDRCESTADDRSEIPPVRAVIVASLLSVPERKSVEWLLSRRLPEMVLSI
jgi:hypothetical protein